MLHLNGPKQCKVWLIVARNSLLYWANSERREYIRLALANLGCTPLKFEKIKTENNDVENIS
jgi:hypothetical protein